MSQIEMHLKGPNQEIACKIAEFIAKWDKTDHVHYGCSWVMRKDGLWHICTEEKRGWKVGPDGY